MRFSGQAAVRRLVRMMLAACVLLVWAVPLRAQAPMQAPGVKAKPRLAWPMSPMGVPVVVQAPASQLVNEAEPNNTIATANLIPFPEEVTGVMNPSGDVDFFTVDLAAGTALEIEVYAQRIGSTMDSYIELIAPDGRTSIAASDDAEPPGLDSRIRTVIPVSGRYIVGIVDLFNRGGPNFNYRLAIRRANVGPGDPTTLFANELGSAWQAAAAPGMLYMLNQEGTLYRITPQGEAESYVNDIGIPYDVAIDGYGRLLISGLNNQLAGVVTRIDLATNARTTFISGLQSAASVTIGPDGDVWVADTRAARILRYDPAGVLRSSFSTSGTHGQDVLDLAFSPSGTLYYSNMQNAIYRVVNDTPERVIQGQGLGGIAFDAEGNLYVGTVLRGILLYDSTHTLLHEPFASTGLQLTGSVVFLRDGGGAMTSRLLGINLGDGTIREMNPEGIRAPGFRIGVDLLTVATDTLRHGVMGAAYADTMRIVEAQAGVTWRVTNGTPPRGVTLSTAGVLSGVPEESGEFSFDARVEGGGRIGVRRMTLTVTRPVVSAASASNHLLGLANQLTPELARFLDLQGNGNGRYDIGDLKAYLRAQAAGGRSNRQEDR